MHKHFIKVAGRKYRIIKRPGFPNYYLRFEHRGKENLWSLGTSILSAAEAIAREKITAFRAGGSSAIERDMLRRIGVPTIGQLIERYKPSPRQVKPETARGNIRTLRLILRTVTGRDNVDELKAEILTGKLLRTFQRMRIDAANGEQEQASAASGCNSQLAAARSVISPRVADLYDDLTLPDFADVRKVRPLPVEKDLSYSPLPPAVLVQIESAAEALRTTAPNIFRAYLLMARLGMRNGEVRRARLGHVTVRFDGVRELEVRFNKNRTPRRLEIAPDVWENLTYKQRPEAEFFIDEPTPTGRRVITDRALNDWLRPMMPGGRTKIAYELRKHAGSIIASRDGIVAAAKFLGDSIATTEKHYATYLKRIPGISGSDYAQRAA